MTNNQLLKKLLKATPEQLKEEANTQVESLTTDELWQELKKRFNSCIFIFERQAETKNTEDIVANNIWYYASLATAMGLIEFAKLRLRTLVKEYQEDE